MLELTVVERIFETGAQEHDTFQVSAGLDFLYPRPDQPWPYHPNRVDLVLPYDQAVELLTTIAQYLNNTANRGIMPHDAEPLTVDLYGVFSKKEGK